MGRHQEAVVVADEEVEPAVAVVVEERRGGAEPAVFRPRRRGDVAERPVAVVVQQMVRPQVSQVDIHPPVVVVVAGGDADAVAGGADAGPLGDVDEADRAGAVGPDLEIVAIEAVGERRGVGRRKDEPVTGRAVERIPLAEVDVEVAVVVVVEQRDRPTHHLGEVERSSHEVVVDEVEPDLARDLLERGLAAAVVRERPGRPEGEEHENAAEKRPRVDHKEKGRGANPPPSEAYSVSERVRTPPTARIRS